jgi:polysaccharide export outer membrane protein
MVMRIFAVCIALLSAVSAWAQSGYQIQPGDQLSIEVLEDPSLNRQVLVLPDGSFSFPLVGRVGAAGQSPQSVQNTLANGLAPNFATTPSVFVSVAGLAPQSALLATGPTVDVYVMGEANNPGKIEVESGTTLLQFLAESGGFTRFAATNRIQLRRGGRIYVFNYRALEKGAVLSNQTTLADGDVIVVPQRKLFEF